MNDAKPPNRKHSLERNNATNAIKNSSPSLLRKTFTPKRQSRFTGLSKGFSLMLLRIHQEAHESAY
jgi:hypothetical protein